MDVVYQLQADAPRWGEYGSVLYHGIAWNTARVDGTVQLERTGPFMPDLTLPSYDVVVVTASLRDKLQRSGLRGFDFRPVAKLRIVRLEWERWPATDEPARYPAGGEPENYVLRRKHDHDAAESLGDLWELVPSNPAALVKNARGNSYHLEIPDVCADFFVGEGVYVSEDAKSWLESNVDGISVNFEPKPLPAA